MGHAHGHTEPGTAAGQHKGRLKGALALTAGFMLVEAIGGVLTGSLALVADAAHMLTDAGGLAMALIAIHFAERPPTRQKTFGYVRLEILSALLNAVVLMALTVFILWEAVTRLLDPPKVMAGPMLAVALAGLVVNLASMKLLAAGSSESLNVKGAYFEVMSDMLGSLGVIVAALVVMFTGWELADPIIGAGIGLFIVPRTWILLRQAIHILMEGTPLGVDVAELEAAIRAVPGVRDVHDLHAWTLTSGLDSMSCHVVIEDMARARETLVAINALLAPRFKPAHTTVQVEDQALRDAETQRRL